MCKGFAEKCSGGMIWRAGNPRHENGRLQTCHQRLILKAFQKGKNGKNSHLEPETFETILSTGHVATHV